MLFNDKELFAEFSKVKAQFEHLDKLRWGDREILTERIERCEVKIVSLADKTHLDGFLNQFNAEQNFYKTKLNAAMSKLNFHLTEINKKILVLDEKLALFNSIFKPILALPVEMDDRCLRGLEIPTGIVNLLKANGFNTVKDLPKNLDELLRIKGLGKKALKTLRLVINGERKI